MQDDRECISQMCIPNLGAPFTIFLPLLVHFLGNIQIQLLKKP